MSFRDIVLMVDSSSEAGARYAVSIASRFKAHLTAAALIVDPTTSMGFLEASAAFVASSLDKLRIAAQQSLRDIEARAQQSGVSVQTELVEAGIGTIVETLGPRLRSFDLVLAEQPHPDLPGDRDVIIETALFGSGRPLLVVPYVWKEPFQIETIMVAWDGGAPAARALSDVMPMLARARRVEVVVVDDGPDRDTIPGPDAQLHLKRHGIEAGLRRLTGTRDIADTLLSQASDTGADLLVMGGYGHSRFREFILGGATEGVLASMTLPVLMAH